MLHLLRTELEAAMAICGIESISDITPQHGHSPGEFCSQDATLHSTIVTLNISIKYFPPMRHVILGKFA
jgi:hypothetical protein